MRALRTFSSGILLLHSPKEFIPTYSTTLSQGLSGLYVTTVGVIGATKEVLEQRQAWYTKGDKRRHAPQDPDRGSFERRPCLRDGHCDHPEERRNRQENKTGEL